MASNNVLVKCILFILLHMMSLINAVIPASNFTNSTSSTLSTSPYITTKFHLFTTLDTGNVAIFGLSTSQLVLIGIVSCVIIFTVISICCVVLYLKHRKHKQKKKEINVDEVDAEKAKIDAFDVYITENKFAAHNVEKAYATNPLRPNSPKKGGTVELKQVKSTSTTRSTPEPKPITVGDLMAANSQKQPKDATSNVVAETPVNDKQDKKKHLKVNLYEDTEYENLQPLALTPHTPSDDEPHLALDVSTNTLRYLPGAYSNAPSQVTLEPLEQSQDTMATKLLDQDTLRSYDTRTMDGDDRGTPTVDDSNDSTAAPIQVQDTLTALIEEHKSKPIEAVDTLTAIIQQQKNKSEDDAKENEKPE